MYLHWPACTRSFFITLSTAEQILYPVFSHYLIPAPDPADQLLRTADHADRRKVLRPSSTFPSDGETLTLNLS